MHYNSARKGKCMEKLKKKNIKSGLYEVGFIAANTVSITEALREQIAKLTENLEDHDDVQRVTSNVEGA